MDLTMEDYFAERPDITPEMMEKARRLTEEKIRAYELKQARCVIEHALRACLSS